MSEAPVVVMGADGFLGRHLVAQLARRGPVTAFDRYPEYRRERVSPLEQTPNVTVIAGDFFNISDLKAAIPPGSFVFHLVSATTPASSHDDPFIDIRVTLEGSVQFLKVCAEQGVRKVIFFSSGGTVYGNSECDRIDEETPTRPRSPYGIAKVATEDYLRYFAAVADFDYIVYRISNPYGPGQNIVGQQGVVSVFLHRILCGEEVPVLGDGHMVRDYIFVEDVARIVAATYSKDNTHPEYNLGSGLGISVNELLQVMEQCCQLPVRRRVVETPQSFVSRSVLDTTRLTREFGMVPQVPLREGIRRTLQHISQLVQPDGSGPHLDLTEQHERSALLHKP